MSTQRREHRWQRTGYTNNANDCSRLWLAFIAFFARYAATVQTAPAAAIERLLKASFRDDLSSPESPEAATISLHSDHQTTQLDRQLFRRASRS